MSHECCGNCLHRRSGKGANLDPRQHFCFGMPPRQSTVTETKLSLVTGQPEARTNVVNMYFSPPETHPPCSLWRPRPDVVQ